MMLLTGIIWGWIAWVIMGRQDKVTIVMDESAETTILVEATGYAAVSKAQEFVMHAQSYRS